MMATSLPKPPLYTPFDKGLYQVGPLLRPFGASFGNPQNVEEKIFQIDNEYPLYRAAKLEALRERKSKYLCESRFSGSARRRIVFFVAEQLAKEHPSAFSWRENAGSRTLLCALSGDEIEMDPSGALRSFVSRETHKATDALEALSLQIQEDFSVWTYEGEEDWMAYVSLCFPNHWAAEDKIGNDFFRVHEPVAGAGPMLKSSKQLVESMVHRGPFVRFAWGVATDRRLNHHPHPPLGIDENEWRGRAFDPAKPQLFVRTERQTLTGFPEERLSLFTIRTYFQSAERVRGHAELREKLKAALLSMTPESLIYKGLAGSRDAILMWLQSES